MKTPHPHPHPSRAVEALAGIDLLREVAPGDLALLARDTDLVEVAAGAVVEQPGSVARQLVGVIDGALRGVGPDGDVVILGPGDQLGAVELLDDRGHTRTYTTVVPTTLVVVFGATFRVLAPSLSGLRSDLLHPRTTGPVPDRRAALAATSR